MTYGNQSKLNGPAMTGYDIGEVVCLPFSFALNGNSNPSTTPGTGLRGEALATVTYSAGTYTVTLNTMGYELLSAVATLQIGSSATVDMYPQLGAIDNTTDPSAPTMVIQLKTVGTNTQPPAANANNWCHCALFIRKRSVTRRRS